jgi:Elongation factor Tu GTP binding domain
MSNAHIRVAVVGDVDASKSTLIGTLVTETLDDGRGLARSKIIKHKHELVTGRTSTISTHMMGLKQTTFETVRGGHQAIALQADRIVTLMDLAGHEKYLKTTVGGVARGMSVSRMTQERISIALHYRHDKYSDLSTCRSGLRLCVGQCRSATNRRDGSAYQVVYQHENPRDCLANQD